MALRSALRRSIHSENFPGSPTLADKITANLCEYFEYIRREWNGAAVPEAAEDKAREKLQKLFGD